MDIDDDLEKRFSDALLALRQGRVVSPDDVNALAAALDRLESPSYQFHARAMRSSMADPASLEAEIASVLAKFELEKTGREVIRERLRRGLLTRQRPHVVNQPDAAVQISSGPAGDCDGCTQAIRDGEWYLKLGPDLRLHERCERIWDEERHRPWRGHGAE